MSRMPVPADEAKRLDALFASGAVNLPDAQVRPLTELARQLAGTKMAHVTILDRDWQWFKAACGLSGSGSSREDAICSHTVAAREALVVPDTLQDARFARNPFVTYPPYVRFYAGIPLYAPESDQPVGTFCVMDDRPRERGDVDLAVLRQLAAIAETQIAQFASVLRRDLASQGRDPVTGLADPTWLYYRLQAALADAEATGSQLAASVVELERLRDVAFARGAWETDRLLAAIGARLAEAAGPAATVGRLDQDSFLVVEPVAAADPLVRAEPLRAAFAEPIDLDTERVSLSARIGVALAPQDGRDSRNLIACAREAAAAAQGGGVTELRAYEPAMTAALSRSLVVERRLAETLRGEHASYPQPVYQPQTDLHSGQVLGAEALLRWHDAELGTVSPGEFIPIAERAGLIHEVDGKARHTACSEAATWPELTGTPGQIAVNVAPAELSAADFVARIDAVLAATGFPAERLVLEVTEGALVDDTGAVAATMRELNGRGVTFAVDDFGTGYCAFRYLQALPVTELKIDRSFIQHLESSPSDRQIVAAMTAMGHELGLTVVAEGVETQGQLALVRELGCDRMQGFLVAGGLPAAAFRARLGTTPLTTARLG